MATKLLGYIFIIVALLLVAGVLYRNSNKSDLPLVFAPSQILNATWLNYKQEYLEAGTSRTLDTSRQNVTTSEGESYTMLRAVWAGDKTTFDNSWTWTKNNLAHKTGDHLFSWLFGKQSNGTYAVLTAQGGDTSASDADTDIALSLLFAYARWQDHSYLGDARVIMADIWSKEVITINGTPYLVADNKETVGTGPTALINPSYLNPAAYKIFAQFDNSHPWGSLVTSSYSVLNKSIDMQLGSKKSAALPPDWITINKTTGTLSAATGSNDSNFGFDALRVPYRLALDYEWFKDPRATSTEAKLSFLSTQWQANQKLASTYAHDGTVVDSSETPAIYGGTIGYFMLADPSIAPNVYQTKMQYLFDPDTNTWKETLSYYDDNWAWFGIALYNNLLPNLTANLPPSAFIQ
jgi:endo-1,4-beta-D-glucanase Y